MTLTGQEKITINIEKTDETLQDNDYNVEKYCLVCKGKGSNFSERVCTFCGGNGQSNHSAKLIYINHVCFCDRVDDGGYCPICYLPCHSNH